MKRPALQNKWVGVLGMALRARKGLSGNRLLALVARSMVKAVTSVKA